MDNAAEAVSAKLALGDETVRWCIRRAERAERRADAEAAAQWAMLAAWVAWRVPYPYLCSPELERLLARLSARIAWVPSRRPAVGPRRWLHVLSITYAIGGHTALARRWIDRNPHRDRHDVLLTFQSAEQIEPRLRDAVKRSGGRTGSVGPDGALLDRARRLRTAAADADVVVLHVHPWDVPAFLAFAQPGGPPVLLLNHQDHAFWAGASSIDLVLDIRTSGRYLTVNYRAVPGNTELPLPLDDPGAAPTDRSGVANRLRFGAGNSTGPLLLTVGRGEKYLPTARLDFLRAAEAILTQMPDARLVAVGPSADDPGWRRLTTATGGRALAIGEDQDLRPWHAAADLYIEGFPIGSYTALLEAALAGRAVVRKPHLVPPDVMPLDEGALAPIHPPTNPSDYAGMVLELASDVDRRQTQAVLNRESILRHHCGPAWNRRLTELCDAIPRVHEPAVGPSVRPLPFELADYWTSYRSSGGGRDAFMVAFLAGLKRGLHPRVDAPMYQALSRAREAGVVSCAPNKALAGGWALSMLPARVAESLYRRVP